MDVVESRGLLLYLLKRVLSLLLVVLLVASAVFAAFFLQQDPERTLLPKGASPELIQHLRSDLKLNEPIPAQYVNFMAKTLSGKFFLSQSLWRGTSIGDRIYTPVTKTLMLFGPVLVLGLLFGIVLGSFFSGIRERRLTSRTARLVCLGAASVPVMSAGLWVLYLLAHQTSIPISRSIVPPLMTSLPIAVGTYILIMKGKERHFTSATTDVRQPIPASSITKLYVAWVMVIVLIAEMIFSYGGLGLITWSSLIQRDGTALMACLFLIAVIIASTNFLLDIVSPFVKSWFSDMRKRSQMNPLRVVTESAPPAAEAAKVSGGRMLVVVARDYLKRPLGIVALIIILALLTMAAAAPLLATVQNPDSIDKMEPNDFQTGLRNPLPPSLDKSPNTGFIHPLGTDNRGRDVYSELLYGARAPLIVAAILVVIAVAIGVIIWIAAAVASSLEGAPAAILGGALSVLSDFVFAVPMFIVFLARSYPDSAQVAFWYSLFVMIPLLVLACTFRVVRVKMASVRRLSSRRTSGTGGGGICATLTGATGSILYISKFVVMFGLLSVLVIQFFYPLQGIVLSTSWAWLSSYAFDYGAFASGAWWLILPQLILTSLLVAAVYKILDTLEQVWVRRFGSL